MCHVHFQRPLCSTCVAAAASEVSVLPGVENGELEDSLAQAVVQRAVAAAVADAEVATEALCVSRALAAVQRCCAPCLHAAQPCLDQAQRGYSALREATTEPPARAKKMAS